MPVEKLEFLKPTKAQRIQFNHEWTPMNTNENAAVLVEGQEE
jgi:hypothetical protein